MADILALGEAMVEFNQTGAAGGRLYLQGFGGDTSNFAVAAARQGAKVGYLSALGDDVYGAMLRAMWRAEGIDDSGVATDRDAFTAIYFVTHDAAGHHFSFFRGGSAASRMRPEQLPRDAIAAARVLHVSGISLALSETARATCFAAMRAARAAGALVSFDTNFRARLWSIDVARAAIDEAIALSDICLPSHDDLAALTGLQEPDALIDHCFGLGARIVALKHGANGAWLADATTRLRIVGASVQARRRDRRGRRIRRRVCRPHRGRRRSRERRPLRRGHRSALDRRLRRGRADSARGADARSARAQPF